jgi:hypothetical protein
MDHGGNERGLDSEKGEDYGCEIFPGKGHGREELTSQLIVIESRFAERR